MQECTTTPPSYARRILELAGIYNLAWGTAVVFFPMAAFQMSDMELPRYPQIWQCVGMIVGVYGVGYLIAARNPYRHWPIVVVGFLGKIFGPIGFFYAAASGTLPWSWGVVIVFNDLIWWVPFAYILFLVVKHESDTSIAQTHDVEDAAPYSHT